MIKGYKRNKANLELIRHQTKKVGIVTCKMLNYLGIKEVSKASYHTTSGNTPIDTYLTLGACECLLLNM